MKYWLSGILLLFLGYSAFFRSGILPGDQRELALDFALSTLPSSLENRYYGDHKVKAEKGNLNSMLQMYLYHRSHGESEKAEQFGADLRAASRAGSAVATMYVNVFLDHYRPVRSEAEQMLFELRLIRERDENPDYRDMWSNRRTADGFATYLSFVNRGDSAAVALWNGEPALWDGWDWPSSEWLRGAILAEAYPDLVNHRTL